MKKEVRVIKKQKDLKKMREDIFSESSFNEGFKKIFFNKGYKLLFLSEKIRKVIDTFGKPLLAAEIIVANRFSIRLNNNYNPHILDKEDDGYLRSFFSKIDFVHHYDGQVIPLEGLLWFEDGSIVKIDSNLSSLIIKETNFDIPIPEYLKGK